MHYQYTLNMQCFLNEQQHAFISRFHLGILYVQEVFPIFYGPFLYKIGKDFLGHTVRIFLYQTSYSGRRILSFISYIFLITVTFSW